MSQKEKRTIREEALRARAGLSKNERKRKSQRIVQRLLDLSLVRSARTLLSYMPTETEADPRKVAERFLKRGKQLAYPRIEGRHLQAIQVKRADPPCESVRGILQPAGGRRIPLSQIDVALVPCVVLDRRGHRIGRGEGYYDRFLKGTKALRVGLAFEAQLFERLPAGRRDVPMDMAVTERRVIDCRRGRGG